jgi:hypothetical protein
MSPAEIARSLRAGAPGAWHILRLLADGKFAARAHSAGRAGQRTSLRKLKSCRLVEDDDPRRTAITELGRQVVAQWSEL